MSLKKKATKGSIWTSLTRTGINVVDFMVYAYLARVLTLEEFGLAGFCFLFIEFANSSFMFFYSLTAISPDAP